MAFQRSREQLGDDATLLYDEYDLPSSMKAICKRHGKEKGGPWECYNASNFFGWEAERVVAVTTGRGNIPEQATRTKTELILVLAEPEEEERKTYYKRIREVIKAAADEGLVDLEAIESENQIENTSNTATEDTQSDADVEVIENENDCIHCCNAM